MSYRAFKYEEEMVEVFGDFTAEETIDRMRQIVEAEMIMHMDYISDDIDMKRKDEGAICGGHRACAVGALYLAFGIVPVYERDEDMGTIWNVTLPGSYAPTRSQFMSRIPELGRAYRALNEAATHVMREYAIRRGTDPDDMFDVDFQHAVNFNGAMEAMFEHYWTAEEEGERVNDGMTQGDKRRMLMMLDRAQEILVMEGVL
jgi:hypothetical protein